MPRTPSATRWIPPSLLVALALFAPPARAEGDGALIASMDDLRFQAPREKAAADLVEGKVGKAERFRFDRDARSVFFTSNIRGTPDWDRAAGFSFWVKGDDAGFGGLQFIDNDDYSLRYDLAFPVKKGKWSKITVAWRDLIPVLPGPRARPLGTSDGENPPSKISALWFGKWWYWGDYPPITFAVDEIRLEPTIDRDTRDYRPDGPPLARVLAKLKAHKPVTVVTMGDSLTDKRHWSNRETAWVDLFRDAVKAKYGSDVTLVNPAIGGTQLAQNLVLIPRWLEKTPEPDLVTVFFGGNDWDAGMRGGEFRVTCADAVDRIRRATRGRADILLMTSNPSAVRWDELSELADACRKAASDRSAGLADTYATFHLLGKDDRNRLFVDDRVHLSRAGHQAVAETALKTIESGGR